MMTAISLARQAARERIWLLAGGHSSDAGVNAKNPLGIDLDAILINVHSEKEHQYSSAGSATTPCARSWITAATGLFGRLNSPSEHT